MIVLVKRSPFTADECGQLDQWLASCKQENGETGAFLPVYELLDPGLNLRKAPEAYFIPDGRPTDSEVMQAALSPLAFTVGTDFKPARHRDLDSELHVDHW